MDAPQYEPNNLTSTNITDLDKKLHIRTFALVKGCCDFSTPSFEKQEVRIAMRLQSLAAQMTSVALVAALGAARAQDQQSASNITSVENRKEICISRKLQTLIQYFHFR